MEANGAASDDHPFGQLPTNNNTKRQSPAMHAACGTLACFRMAGNKQPKTPMNNPSPLSGLVHALSRGIEAESIAKLPKNSDAADLMSKSKICLTFVPSSVSACTAIFTGA